MRKSFTIEEMLQAAEQAKLPNMNSSFIGYPPDETYGTIKDKISHRNYTAKPENGAPIMACVIGEAFLNLGFVPNGLSPMALSHALSETKPDNGEVFIGGGRFYNLASFINELNDDPRYRGKKRIARLVRKHFSRSLHKIIYVSRDSEEFYLL